ENWNTTQPLGSLAETVGFWTCPSRSCACSNISCAIPAWCLRSICSVNVAGGETLLQQQPSSVLFHDYAKRSATQICSTYVARSGICSGSRYLCIRTDVPTDADL